MNHREIFITIKPNKGHRGMVANEDTTLDSNSYWKVKIFKYLGSLLSNQNSTYEEIRCRFKAGNSCCYSVQILLSSRQIWKMIYKKNNVVSCAKWLWKRPDQTKEVRWGQNLHVCRRFPSFCYSFLLSKSIAQM